MNMLPESSSLFVEVDDAVDEAEDDLETVGYRTMGDCTGESGSGRI
jgi:hypothetical protein